MHTDFFRHVLNHHRLQLINAFVEKLGLPPDDSLANFHDDVFTLLNIFQELDRGFEAVFDIVLHILVDSAALQHVPVGRAQAKLWYLIFVRHNRVLPAHFHDEYIGLDQAGLRSVVLLSGPGIELFDNLDLFHDDVERLVERLGDFFELLVLQLVQMVANNLDCDAFILAQYRQLDPQAFANVSRSDAWRIEVLNDFERLLHFLERVFTTFGDFLERDRNLTAAFINSAEISVFVQISDNRMASEADIFFYHLQTELPFQMVGEGLGFRQEVLK